jgi:phage terminase large subunit-like protein
MNPKLEELYKNLLIKKKMKGLDDLYFFNKYILEQSESRRKFIVPHVHGEWATWFKNSTKRIKMMLVPRSCFKTTFMTVGYSLQRMAKDRNIRILLANATLGNSQKFLDEIKWHLQNNKEFLKFYGGYKNGDEEGFGFYDMKNKWNDTEISISGRTITSQTPTVTATGVGGNLVSQHYNLIINDDLINLENSATKLQADKVIDWWKKSHSLLEPDGEMFIVGTRWAYYELYQYLIDHMKDKVDFYIRSAYNPDGTFYFPERFSEEVLKDLRALHGSYSFSAFYLNDPVDEETALIKKSHIKYWGNDMGDKPLPRVLNIFSTCDPAVSQSTDADNSVIMTVGIDLDDNWYVLEVLREQWTVGELVNNLFEVAKTWKPISMSLEVIGQAQGLLEPIQNEEDKRKIYLSLTEIKVRPQVTKEMRIRSILQPRFENGKIFIKHGMEDLEDELLRFPKAKSDDMADCMTDVEEIGFRPDPSTPTNVPEGGYFEGQLTAGVLKKKEEPADPVMGEDF